jgi:predicted ATPase
MVDMAVRLNRAGNRPFIGRARELTAAADILADAERTGVVLIGGESGLGKTRLAEEIIGSVAPAGRVIRGVAVPRATPIPFELVRSALDPVEARSGTGTPSEDPEPLGADTGTTVARVRAEAEALRTAGQSPTIYLFEDVHWADPESLDVIDRLMVSGPLGATILITYRPNALHPGHPTSTFLQRAERRPQVAQFRLEPLRREEVEAYLAATGRPVDPATVEHVHTRTGGNPLLLSELEAAFADDTDLTAGLPWTLAEMLRPEIDRLPSEERVVVEAVAVLGAEVDFEWLAIALDATENRLVEQLRALVDRGILTESGPDRFGFRHDMVREAVADSLFTRERRRIHAAVHDALLAAGSDDVVALVAHATGAGRTKQAADAARDAAARALVVGRTHQALAFAEQALLVHTDDIKLLRIAVVSGWMTGQDRSALHHLDRWEELAGSSSIERAEVLHYRIRLLWEEGDGAAADRAARDLAFLTETLDHGPALAQALANLA